MALHDPVAHLWFESVHSGSLVGKGNKWVTTMVD
jgi:hypothetical protein